MAASLEQLIAALSFGPLIDALSREAPTPACARLKRTLEELAINLEAPLFASHVTEDNMFEAYEVSLRRHKRNISLCEQALEYVEKTGVKAARKEGYESHLRRMLSEFRSWEERDKQILSTVQFK